MTHRAAGTRGKVLVAVTALAALLPLFHPPRAAAVQPACRRAVIFTLPGTTWYDVERFRPPNLLEAVDDGAAGSVSVRTNSARTSLASGFATIGAGARMDGGRSTGGAQEVIAPDALLVPDVKAAGVDELRRLAAGAAYGAVPGALGETLQEQPLVAVGNGDVGGGPGIPLGHGRWTLLAAMDAAGVVDRAAVGTRLLTAGPEGLFGVQTDAAAIRAALDEALDLACASVVVDQGDLTRADHLELLRGAPAPQIRSVAVRAADDLLGFLRARLTPADLLVIVSPTSPAWDPDVHFGVAVAVGRGFPAGASLASPTTGRRGLVTLPDVAPTVLDHLGVARPDVMLGRPWFTVAPVAGDRVGAAVDLDDEATFVDRVRTPVSSGFVVFQALVYLLILVLVGSKGERRVLRGRAGRWLELGALAVVVLPAATYLLGFVDQHALGAVGFTAALVALDLVLAGAVFLSARLPLDRLLVAIAGTWLLLLIDGVTGTHLQVNTVFSYSPIVAGRFVGFGNIAYSVFAATALITATLVVHRWGRSARSLVAAGAIFLVTIVVDGAPQFGSDVGGILALVPGFAIAWILLAGKKPTVKLLALVLLALVVALAAFVAVDLARPEEARTHLARLVEDVRARGPSALGDTIVRKARTNIRVFGSTIWTYLVPPALAVIAWLFLRPRGRWERFAITQPTLRAGLIAGLTLAVIGFLVNDSGIVIPALMLSFLVPLALFIHLSLERGLLAEERT